MPTPRKYASNAERQAAYRSRRSLGKEMKPAISEQPILQRIPPTPGEHRWKAMLGAACSLVESVIDEMESYYEERSERWQESERGEIFSEKMETVVEVADLLRGLP